LKKILFIVNQAEFFISHRLPLAIEAKKQGFEVAIATGESPKLLALKKYGFEIYPLKITRSGFNIIAEMLEIAKVIKSTQPNIVHLVSIKPVLLGGLVCRLLSVPAVIYAISGLGFIFITQGFVAIIKRFIVKLFYKISLAHKNSKVIFQNDEDSQLFLNNKLVKSSQIIKIKGSGVDIKKFTPFEPNNEKVRIILPARMLKDKGVFEFIEAAKIIGNQKALFFLVGGLDEGGNPTRLKKQDLENLENITWLGHQDNILEVMQKADIVCLPSYREGLPKSLCEACACGKAIVTTDTVGCREVVTDGVNGFLVPIKTVKPLVIALNRLIENKNLRDDFGKEGRKKAEKEFSLESIKAQTMALYLSF
jgi:glycosyltransferase involved in cell wall biosynthesis